MAGAGAGAGAGGGGGSVVGAGGGGEAGGGAGSCATMGGAAGGAGGGAGPGAGGMPGCGAGAAGGGAGGAPGTGRTGGAGFAGTEVLAKGEVLSHCTVLMFWKEPAARNPMKPSGRLPTISRYRLIFAGATTFAVACPRMARGVTKAPFGCQAPCAAAVAAAALNPWPAPRAFLIEGRRVNRHSTANSRTSHPSCRYASIYAKPVRSRSSVVTRG